MMLFNDHAKYVESVCPTGVRELSFKYCGSPVYTYRYESPWRGNGRFNSMSFVGYYDN